MIGSTVAGTATITEFSSELPSEVPVIAPA